MAVVNVKSEIAGNVWKIQLKAGDKVELEGEIMILESMKMEIPVLSPKAGTIKEIRVNEGEAIGEGQLVVRLLYPGLDVEPSTVQRGPCCRHIIACGPRPQRELAGERKGLSDADHLHRHEVGESRIAHREILNAGHEHRIRAGASWRHTRPGGIRIGGGRLY